MKRIGVFVVLAACGGVDTATDAGSDASSDATVSDVALFDVALDVSGDAGLADVTPPTGTCPQTAPAADASCASAGLECEYGTSWYEHCDAIYTCGDAGAWTGGTIASCPNAGNCPSDPTAAPSCTPSVGPCDYADRHCECATQCGGPCCGNGVYWQCSVPSKNACPFPRPNLGTACSNEGQSCQYGTCCTGSALRCTGGLWRADICPIPP